ncbi:MAG: flagellar hook-length control protein FliK [Clostridia bacterium]|nr:flagellar hook-length control protein FliK [Clostridia bacterium]
MINVNGSGIFNQQTQISEQSKTPVSQSQSSGAASPQQAVSQAVHDLRSLMAGDAFTGQVASLDGSSVTLTLPNGSQINATLQNQVNLIKGQNLTFLVADNNGTTITLKPMQFLDEQTSYVAGKALEAAGLASTPANEEIVHELLGQNMSISAQTLNDMAKAAAKYPDAGIDTLTRLYKLDIPITQENIQQFEAYKSYENRISGEILNLSSGLSDMISNALLENGQAGATELSKDILNILYGSENSPETLKNAAGNDNAATDGALNTSEPAANAGETISKFLDGTARDNLKAMLSKAFPDGLPENLQKKITDGSASARELTDSFNQLMASEKAEPKALSQFFKSDEFKGLMEMIMRDTMHLSPKDVKEKDAVKDFYEKVRNDVDKLSKLVDDKAGNNSQLAKSLGNVRENIEFMNELNKNMTFVQMPIKFSENNANGELYVFTNKKSLKQNKDDISALLHLDMENLGPMDIFVKLKGKNVSTNFCLESEEMLDFIYAHIDRLNERLEKLGFNCKFEMKVKEDSQKQFDFVQDFIDADLPKVHSTTQFVFDRKA